MDDVDDGVSVTSGRPGGGERADQPRYGDIGMNDLPSRTGTGRDGARGDEHSAGGRVTTDRARRATALAVLAGLWLTGCAGGASPDPVVRAGAPSSTDGAETGAGPGSAAPSSGPVRNAVESVRGGLSADVLPSGYVLLEELERDGDAEPVRMYGPPADDGIGDPTRLVTVRVVPMPEAVRDTQPAHASDGVLAEPRDDIAAGAVLYTIKDSGDASLTTPSGEFDVIIAARGENAADVLAFAEAVTT